MLDKVFCDGILRALARVQREREERDTCPKEEDGCGRPDALCSVTKRGASLGRFCPHCRWTSRGLAAIAGAPKRNPPKKQARRRARA